jgi:hypothetical protein
MQVVSGWALARVRPFRDRSRIVPPHRSNTRRCASSHHQQVHMLHWVVVVARPFVPASSYSCAHTYAHPYAHPYVHHYAHPYALESKERVGHSGRV